MAKYAAKYPVIATRTETTSGSTYSDGLYCGKFIQAQITPNSTDTKLYGDDEIAERVVAFTDASITLNTTTLPIDAAVKMFGATHTTASGYDQLDYGDMNTPFVGFGFITTESVSNTMTYKVMWFPKTKFALPSETYDTKGENVSFGTPSFTGSAQLDGSVWKQEFIYSTADDAVAKLKSLAGIS